MAYDDDSSRGIEAVTDAHLEYALETSGYFLIGNECEQQGQCQTSARDMAEALHAHDGFRRFAVNGGKVIVGGSLMHERGQKWMRDFHVHYYSLPGPKVVAGIHVHVYPQDGLGVNGQIEADLRAALQLHTLFNGELWITETSFLNGSPEENVEFASKLFDILHNDSRFVGKFNRVAWFGDFIQNHPYAETSVLDADGYLTDVGEEVRKWHFRNERTCSTGVDCLPNGR